MPMLAGLATVGMTMVQANQVASLNATAGQMISSGVDFTQAENVSILQKVAGTLQTSSTGTGAVIVSEVDYSTSNGYVCSNQITIPIAGGTGTSQYVPGGLVGSFASLMPGMTDGQVAYLAETYYNNPQFAWALAPSGTASGIYVKAVF